MDAGLVSAVLDAHDRRWFAGLANMLVHTRWAAVEASTGLARATYGTGRYLACNPSGRRDDLTTVSLCSLCQTDATVIVERLHGESLRRYSTRGLDFYEPEDVTVGVVRHRLEGAFRRLGEVPDAAAAVGALLAVLHVVKPSHPDYDVSYSDPLLPFSIFVGIETGDQANRDLRLAEGILHECMHLQLTLIEEVVPMTAGSREQYHSPWQGTMRPSQGVLHGLYVFRVIQDFYRALLDASRCAADERAYITRRIGVIEEEVAALGDFSASRDLTSAGRRLATALLAA
jgi:HEXXH motif-containing protein